MSVSSDRPVRADILIVDDTLPNLRLLNSMLVSSGYQVREAGDGLTALDSVRLQLPDLILLDVRMPGMDGYDVCRRLKADPVTQGIPVIFVSAMDEQADKIQGFAAGGVDYITKPFQLREVLARVETHLTIRSLQRQLELQNTRLQQEVADRHQAEKALQVANEALEIHVQERTAQLNEIMNTVPEGVLLLDPLGRVAVANPLARQMLHELSAYLPGERLTRLGDWNLPALPMPDKELSREIQHGTRFFELLGRPMVATNGEQSWVLVIRDVTQERETQRRAQQQERLAAVGQLAAGISHDFNNILAVIQLYTEMMLGVPTIDTQMRDRLSTVAWQTRRASELIQQILDFSRRTALERSPIDLLPFLKEQLKLLERTLPENIRIRLNYSPGEYVTQADPTRMQQVIMNLALNARDAMPDGGDLNFALQRSVPESGFRCPDCGRHLPGDWIQLSVTDNGVGIPAESLPHIFEPFFTTKNRGQGTGLGLAQVYGIIEKHDGHIDVHSEIGHGATFSLYLPALPLNRQPFSESSANVAMRGRGETILLVEDEPAIRQALSEGLSLLNYQVVPVQNGREGLDCLVKTTPRIDLVLSDVVMPEMGGVALFQAMRAQGISVPVILMTGHPMQDELEKLREQGLIAWILKPPRLKQLATLIAQTIR